MSVQPIVTVTSEPAIWGAPSPLSASVAPLRVLALTDDPADKLLLEQLLRPCDQEFRLLHASLSADSVSGLATFPCDVALVVLSFHDPASLDVIRQARAALPGVPLIVLTGASDERFARLALQEGTQDYLLKSHVSALSLARSIHYAIERQRLQLRSEQSGHQQLCLKDEFLSHVSHELRSPLAAIDQFLSLLLDNIPGELNSEQREFVQIAARNTGELRGLIDDLLDTTRAETGKLTVEPACVAAAHLVSSAVERHSALALDRGIALTSYVSPGLSPVSADPQRVKQILGNLLDNACKFTPAGGSITVRAESAAELPGFLHFSVADTGSGIAPEAMPHVFDRLYQDTASAKLPHKGLGLGLFIARELVTRHGGRIWAESQPKLGTTFHFTLPAFTLDALLAPLIEAAASKKEDFTLVSVALAPAAPTKCRFEEAFFAALALTLRRCTLPDMDVLLPRFECLDRSAKFFIVACTNERGARVLMQRIKDQICALPQFSSHGPALHVSSAVLCTARSGAAASTGGLLQCVAAQVQRKIQDWEGMAHHGG